ncbi:MAG: TonB-dependent receptor, partial [Bacteroidota bacterium]
KSMEGLVEIARINNGFMDQQTGPGNGEYALFTGTGQATGIDLLLTTEWGNYSGWVAYTLSKITNQYPEIRNNTSFAGQNDRRHQLKWLNTYKTGKWEWSANWIYTSGRPYTDVSILSPDQDRRLINPQDRLDRLPAYWRLDLGVNYRFKIKSLDANIGASVFNVTDRANVKYLQFIYSLPGEQTMPQNEVLGTQTNLLPRTVNLNVGLRF